eukprot:4973048-Amphidinium_carterae.1
MERLDYGLRTLKVETAQTASSEARDFHFRKVSHPHVLLGPWLCLHACRHEAALTERRMEL